jgi:hypothetical protein
MLEQKDKRKHNFIDMLALCSTIASIKIEEQAHGYRQ